MGCHVKHSYCGCVFCLSIWKRENLYNSTNDFQYEFRPFLFSLSIAFCLFLLLSDALIPDIISVVYLEINLVFSSFSSSFQIMYLFMQKCFFQWKTQKCVQLIAVQLFEMNFRQSVKLIIWPLNNIQTHRQTIIEYDTRINCWYFHCLFFRGSIKLEI